MNAAPLVSIIIPVYNTEQYLAECLDSVCGQTLREIEIICVNDGSRDLSLEILQAYAQKDERIRVIDQPNRGVSVARNRGIEEATGKYIYFVDSDDKIDLDLCEQAVASAEKIDADLVYLPVYDPLKSKKFQQVTKFHFVDSSSEERALGLSIIGGGAPFENFIKRKFLLDNNLRFPIGIRIGEDICLTLQIWALVKNFVILPKRFYWYRLRTTSVTGSMASNTDKLFDIFKVYDIVKPYYASENAEKLRRVFLYRILHAFFYGYGVLNKEERKKFESYVEAICDDDILKFIRSANNLSYQEKIFYNKNWGTKFQRCEVYLIKIKLFIARWKRKIKEKGKNFLRTEKVVQSVWLHR